jgi:hypothetical protein
VYPDGYPSGSERSSCSATTPMTTQSYAMSDHGCASSPQSSYITPAGCNTSPYWAEGFVSITETCCCLRSCICGTAGCAVRGVERSRASYRVSCLTTHRLTPLDLLCVRRRRTSAKK